MKYLLALVGPEWSPDDVSPEQMESVLAPWDAFERELTEAGAFIAGEALTETKYAATVRIEDGGDQPLVTDGPYTEAKETLGGFYLIEAADRDEAIAWAKKVPLPEGAIEVRAVLDFSEYTQ